VLIDVNQVGREGGREQGVFTRVHAVLKRHPFTPILLLTSLHPSLDPSLPPSLPPFQLTHMAARKAKDEDHAIRRLLKELGRTLRVRALPPSLPPSLPASCSYSIHPFLCLLLFLMFLSSLPPSLPRRCSERRNLSSSLLMAPPL
jgi:hypothetical protein